MGDDSINISGVAVIILIAIGILSFIILFIFAKRQIVRFALKSHHGIHVPIGADAPKHIRQEIERRLNIVKDIRCEPQLINPDNSTHHNDRNHFYRMKTVDSLGILEKAIEESNCDPMYKRPAGQDLRVYLLRLTKDNGPLAKCDTKLIDQFVDCYNIARHEPTPVFGKEDYENYLNLLNAIKSHLNIKSTSTNDKNAGILKQRNCAAQMIQNGKTQVSIVNNQDAEETSV